MDALTAKVHPIAKLPGGSAAGLGLLPDGNLVLAGAGLRILDPKSGQVLRELIPPGVFATSGDVAFNANDGLLYWSIQGGDALVALDAGSGQLLSTLSLGEPYVFGLAIFAGSVDAFSEDGSRLTIDPRTGAMSNANLPGRWYGAASRP